MNPLLITLGVIVAGGCGALLRWLLSRLNPTMSVPAGTLIANVAGSFALGVLVAQDAPGQAIVGTGFVGALTTFSTLINEIVDLAEQDRRPLAATYLIATMITGVSAALAGLQFT